MALCQVLMQPLGNFALLTVIENIKSMGILLPSIVGETQKEEEENIRC